jgi:cysteine synthase A
MSLTSPAPAQVPCDAAARMHSLRRLVGNTPLIELRVGYHGKEYSLYAKLETLNFSGSIKDRMAFHILEDAYAHGHIQAGDAIVEATSGNTGISFAAIGRALGHPVRIHMPDWMSRERVQIIQSLGAVVVPISAEQGGFVGSIEAVPRQFQNEANVRAHYKTTGPELITQLDLYGKRPTGFVAGVGTGGTVMGVGQCFREQVPEATIHPLEPANSPTLKTGHKVGKHRIQGISDEFIPAIVDLPSLDSIVDAWDGDSILMAQQLARQLGLGVGISSGANLLGALKIAEEQGESSVVATVFPDSNKKYLSTATKPVGRLPYRSSCVMSSGPVVL